MRKAGSSVRRSRVPIVRQYAETDCGPACLLSVLRHWGGDASVAEVRSETGTDLRGSSLFQLSRAAAGIGFEARGATGTYDELGSVTLPAIAHIVREGRLLHYVVVERVTAERIWIMDPSVGRQAMPRQAFEELWRSRAVLLLDPTDRLLCHPPEPWWRWIARHLNGEQTFFAQSVFLGAIYTGLGLLTSMFIKHLLDEFIPRRDARTLWLAGGLLLATLLCRAAAGYGRQRLLATLQRRVGSALNREFVYRLFDLSLAFFERTRKGDITARLQDSLRVQTGALQIVGGVIIDGMLVIGALLGLAAIALPLTWIALAALPFYGTLLVWSARELHARQNTALRAFTDAEAKYIDSLQGIRDVLGSGAGASFAERNHVSWASFLCALEQFAVRQASLGAAAEAVGSTVLVGGLVYGASLVIAGRLQLGAMIGGYTLLALLLPAIARLADLFVVFQITKVSGARVLDVLHVPRQSGQGDRPFIMDSTLELTDVSFTWSRGTQQLTDVHLTLRCGRIVGLTGTNGAGKTTLVKLLRREYEPTSGRLLVDGRDARQVRLSEFRTGVALLASDVSIFSGSLYENVAVHRPEVTPERLVNTIVESGLQSFMQRFPGGLATAIGEEGRQLSAGERYVVGLLRAIIVQPRVLIVDEAFAMLDANYFRIMLDAICRFASRNAVLLISHDPTVLSHAHEILVLDGGRVVRTQIKEWERTRGLDDAILSSAS